jgi:hypothetical protein
MHIITFDNHHHQEVLDGDNGRCTAQQRLSDIGGHSFHAIELYKVKTFDCRVL